MDIITKICYNPIVFFCFVLFCFLRVGSGKHYAVNIAKIT